MKKTPSSFKKRRRIKRAGKRPVNEPLSWLSCAVRHDIVRYSGKMAIFVGTLLMLINHGDKLWLGQLTLVDWLKIGLTYLVPYAVSTWSCVDTYRRHHVKK